MSTYPTLKKFDEIRESLTCIDEFLSWCANQRITLAESHDTGPLSPFWPIGGSRQDLLMRYFEIDTKELEKERRQLLIDSAK